MRVHRACLVAMTGGQLLLASGQTFNRRYDPFNQGYGQFAYSIDRNGADGYAVTVNGNYDDSVYLYITAMMIRLNAQGAVLSESKMLGGMSSVYAGWANCATSVSDGGIAIGGSTHPPSDIRNAAIIRYAANGDSLWLREYGDGVDNWFGRQVKQTKDGGLLLCGETAATGFYDAFLIKTDSAGNEEWHLTYGGVQWYDGAISVDTTADDGYFFGGIHRPSQFNDDFWVVRVAANGDSLWSRSWGTPYDEPNAHLTTFANGNPVIASASGYQQNNGVARLYMAELDQDDGHIIWGRFYGALSLASLFAVKEVRPGEGGIAAGGYMEPDSVNYLKGVLVRAAPNGDSLWMRTYVYYDSLITDGMGLFRDVIPTNDGGFIACGVTNGCYSGMCPPGYEQDAWVVKVDSMGCLVPGCAGFLGITSQITNMGYALNVYPNPVRDQLQISIKLPANFKTEGPLALTVVSMQGKLVRQEGLPTSAPNEVVLDVTGLASGAYTVHLSDAHTWIAGKKFVVE